MADWTGWILVVLAALLVLVVVVLVLVVRAVLIGASESMERNDSMLRTFANHALSVSESGLDLRRIDADERRLELTERTPAKRVTDGAGIHDATVGDGIGFGGQFGGQ